MGYDHICKIHTYVDMKSLLIVFVGFEALSSVLLPPQVVQALNLNIHELGQEIKLHSGYYTAYII